MEAECSRCHRKFQSSTEEMTICPKCLRAEFSQAAPAGDGAGSVAIKQDNQISLRRAAARAERLSDGLQTGSSLAPHRTLRFVLGVLIFLICAGMFMVGTEMEEWLGRPFMPEAAQRPVSVLLCWAAAVLVFSSFRQNKWLIYLLVGVFVVLGWFMPTFWEGVSARKKKGTAVAIASSKVGSEAVAVEQGVARTERALTEEDLAIFRGKKQSEGHVVNYAIYVNTRDVTLRQSIRDTLARLLETSSCVPYTRGKGTLFIISRSVGGTRNITRTMERFGDVTYANPDEGIYELSFVPEKVNAVSRFNAEELSSPHDDSFVEANTEELRNLIDPRRVRTAADTLISANVQQRRGEVLRVLLEVLRDPWESEPDTYESLMEALATYATPGDKTALDLCRKYFLHARAIRRTPTHAVVALLIRESPGEMVSPMVELWCADPSEWGALLAELGTMTQDHLLEVLERTESPLLVSSILKHLEHNGTPEAVPVLRKYVDHADSRISRPAQDAVRALEM